MVAAGLLMNMSLVEAAQSKILVAYFSRVGNEYGVGSITKGNTAIIADIIASETSADTFEIKTVKAYPIDYDDTIFIGYPIWYGDMPMAVYTFLESYDFSGKKIVPFCTHGGSGLSSTDQALTLACPNSEILRGFEIRGAIAQKQTSEAKQKVLTWLKTIGR